MIQDAVRALGDDGRGWVQLGVIESIEVHAAFGVLLNCSVQPDGGDCQARMMSFGAGQGTGAFPRVRAGDEVVLLFPGGNRNRAVAIVGLASLAAQIPESWGDGDHYEFCDGNGVKVRLAAVNPVQSVVLESILAPLAAALVELAAAPTALGLPTTQALGLASVLQTAPTTHRSQALKTE